MTTKTLSVTEGQARLLQEMLQLPQLTITFPKATEAGILYDAINGVVSEFDAEKAAANAESSQSPQAMMDPS